MYRIRKYLTLSVLLCFCVMGAYSQNSDYVAYIDKYKDLAIEQMKRTALPYGVRKRILSRIWTYPAPKTM